MRLLVRVKPGAPRTQVGGVHPGPRGEALVVAVQARAVDGAANSAVVDALAVAFDVRRRDVRIASGVRSRDKLVDIDGEGLKEALARLRGGAAR